MKKRGQFIVRGSKFALSFAWEFIGEDLLLKITGGKAHIGAVSLSDKKNRITKRITLERKHHRESLITQKAVQMLGSAVQGAVCCLAGIHFDDLDCHEVEQLVRLSFSGLRRLKKICRA